MERVILGWSGGIDSTYLLWKLLNEGKNVNALNIHMRYGKNQRWKEERESCRKIKEWLNKNGLDFVYTYADYRLRYITLDQDVILFFLAQYALGCKQDCSVALGIIKDDYERWISEIGYYPTVGREIFKQAISNGEFVFGKGNFTHRVDSEVKMPIKHLTKKEVVKMIPPELLELTWSCRRPINGQRCNECRACKEEIKWRE